MKHKYSSADRIAGLFVVAGLGLLLGYAVMFASKQGWFERKSSFMVSLTKSEDLREGTSIELNGVPIGYVAKVELQASHAVRVQIKVRHSFTRMVTEGSGIRFFRPNLLGQKLLELVPAEGNSQQAAENSYLAMLPSADPLDALGSKGIGESMERLASLIKQLDGIATQANRKNNLEKTLGNVAALTETLKVALPHYTKHAAESGRDLALLTKNLTSISTQVDAMMPAMREIAKTGPESSRLLTEALHETNILVKALQRSFLIRGNVEDVKEEEAKQRLPASSSETKP